MNNVAYISFSPVLFEAVVDWEEGEQEAKQGKDGEHYNRKIDQVKHLKLWSLWDWTRTFHESPYLSDNNCHYFETEVCPPAQIQTSVTKPS